MKFEHSENEFKASSLMIEKKYKSLLDKLDKVKINLSVRFFDKITRQFYESYDKVHSKMANAQNELNDIVTEINKASIVKHERFNTETDYTTNFANVSNPVSAASTFNF